MPVQIERRVSFEVLRRN